jgi:hypothetical protein
MAGMAEARLDFFWSLFRPPLAGVEGAGAPENEMSFDMYPEAGAIDCGRPAMRSCLRPDVGKACGPAGEGLDEPVGFLSLGSGSGAHVSIGK